jgi:hypothetical protein
MRSMKSTLRETSRNKAQEIEMLKDAFDSAWRYAPKNGLQLCDIFTQCHMTSYKCRTRNLPFRDKFSES